MLEKINRLSKKLEFKIGFFGWFIYANIIFSIIALRMIAVPSIQNGFLLVVIGIWIPTAIFLIILFGMEKVEAGSGVLVAVVVNSMILCLYPVSFSYLFFLLPFPSAHIFYFFIVMAGISPPYHNFGHLMDFYSRQ